MQSRFQFFNTASNSAQSQEVQGREVPMPLRQRLVVLRGALDNIIRVIPAPQLPPTVAAGETSPESNVLFDPAQNSQKYGVSTGSNNKDVITASATAIAEAVPAGNILTNMGERI